MTENKDMEYEKTVFSDGTVFETFENDNLRAICFAGSTSVEFKPTCSDKVKDIYAKLMGVANDIPKA